MSEGFQHIGDISESENQPIDLERITSRKLANAALVVLRRVVKKYQGIVAEAQSVVSEPYHNYTDNLTKADWAAQVKGIKEEIIPGLEANIRAIEEKIPSLPES